jgi:membrane protein DedA with SNARE-associated domain
VRPVGGVVTAGIGSAGMPGLFGLLLAMEAGVPVPVPGDVVMLLVGERVSAGALPLWLAVAALELVAVAGTATLFLLARGPARTLLARVGPRVGLTEARRARASALLERRGLPALATGRCTPGLRTVTVVAVAWLLRRRAGRGRMLLEGCCPACLAAGALASARPRTHSESELAP